MNIWKLGIKNLRHKPLYTTLNVFSFGISIALLVGLQQLKSGTDYQLQHSLSDIELVVGAKGSPLQLILASVLHIDNPTGNIALEDAQRIGEHPMVKTAVPIAYGDNYKGYRIVGTNVEFVKLYNAELQLGQYVTASMQVVLGSSVAKKLNLKLGDTFKSAHGLVDNEVEVHEKPLRVVGILKPTQQPIDRLIITQLETVWELHEHEASEPHKQHQDGGHKDALAAHNNTLHGHEDGHQKLQLTQSAHSEKQITALLLRFKNMAALLRYNRHINTKTNLQAAIPKYELDKLHSFTGFGLQSIGAIAYLVLIISGISMAIHLYKMVEEQRFDLMLMRTYGATPLQLVTILIVEVVCIASASLVLACLVLCIGYYILLDNIADIYVPFLAFPMQIADIIQVLFTVSVPLILAVAIAAYPILKMNIPKLLYHEK